AGALSLRALITQAKKDDTIQFGIPMADPGYNKATDTFLIKLQSCLTISTPITIDATTQKDKTGRAVGLTRPIIELNGAAAAKGDNGLTINARGCTVKGLVINGFQVDAKRDGGNGIVINGPGKNIIVGNYIGTDVTGMKTYSFKDVGDGVFINNSPDN